MESNLAREVALTQKELKQTQQEVDNDKLVDKNLITIYQEKMHQLRSETDQKLMDKDATIGSLKE